MLTCPICEKSDAVRCKEDPRFYRDGRLTAICFHGHGNGKPVVFDAETGATLQHVSLEPFEALYHALESGGARGFGAAFLAEHCGIYQVTRAALATVQVPFPTEQNLIEAEKQDAVIVAAPLFDGAAMVGLELRMVEASSGKVQRWFKVLGAQGLYIANPRIQPKAVVAMEGTWDAVAGAWDAFQNDSQNYAFTSIKAGTKVQQVIRTHEAHFPGVPVLIITDQDGAGKGARHRLRKAGTLAILPGTGMAKDYREADSKARWNALLAGIEQALLRGAVRDQDETGLALIARRALEGTIRAKQEGYRDLEAWRFGQRCAGICKAATGGKRYFSIRASIHGRPPIAEGLYDFAPILDHRMARDIRVDYPSLASVIEGGATESPLSPEWKPPMFLPNGEHWSALPPEFRKDYAIEHGWEPWTGQDIGTYTSEDLFDVIEAISNAYHYVIIPGAPAAETGVRVAAVAFATALCGLRSQEFSQGGAPGFNPGTWFYGGPATGKGTAAKITACAISGESRTYGSQRFGGEKENGWLTESALHLPVIFKDELDQYLDRSASEDLKAFLGGEALQRRKAYGVDMTLYPRPVVFSTNEIKINPEDEATKERIILVELQPNPLASKHQRSNAFEAFHDWMRDSNGKLRLHRVAVHLYGSFRGRTIGRSRFTRSAVFDEALGVVCEALEIDPTLVMSPSEANKEAAILRGSPWYQSIAEHIQFEMNGADEFHVKATDLWGIRVEDESQKKKLRRYLDAFRTSAREHDGYLTIMGYWVDVPPFHNTAANTLIRFRRAQNAEAS